MQKVIDGLEQAENLASSIDSIASSVLSTQEEIKQFQENTKWIRFEPQIILRFREITGEAKKHVGIQSVPR